jgi:hypothetical protein
MARGLLHRGDTEKKFSPEPLGKWRRTVAFGV